VPTPGAPTHPHGHAGAAAHAGVSSIAARFGGGGGGAALFGGSTLELSVLGGGGGSTSSLYRPKAE
jgi:hypothetical protein